MSNFAARLSTSQPVAASCFHSFSPSVAASAALPLRFTYPFNYSPHSLTIAARDAVLEHLQGSPLWECLMHDGKMFGVLVVETAEGEIGYLAGFSGNLDGRNRLPFFVPPIVDLLDPDGFYKRGEAEITAINHEIASLEHSDELQQSLVHGAELQARQRAEEQDFVQLMRTSKIQRDAQRRAGNADVETLIAESQWQKAELKRIRQRHREEMARQEAQAAKLQQAIVSLRERRKMLSESLQQRLFEMYVVSNARGERNDVLAIFRAGGLGLPPAGTGECAAPKLLNFAYQHRLKPMCMGEFWVGRSPESSVRHTGNFYPACRSKCRPLLSFMLQGLEVEPNPHEGDTSNLAVSVLHDDAHIAIVDKPSGLLSVPGRVEAASLQAQLAQLFPLCPDAKVAHRLDRDTSGIVVVAKTREAFVKMQRMFALREVEKTYIAVLDGHVSSDEGLIELPLRGDHMNRPFQIVDYEKGIDAKTLYRVLERFANEHGKPVARVEFRPLTGRTHQLRVHAAHPQGLNAPIVGDCLYGTPGKRLMLHAQRIEFRHPITNTPISIASREPF